LLDESLFFQRWESVPERVAALEQLVDETVRGVIRRLAEEGVPLPEPGYELASDPGEIIATAELAWPDVKVAVLLEAEEFGAPHFEARGWKVLRAADVIAEPERLIAVAPREETK